MNRIGLLAGSALLAGSTAAAAQTLPARVYVGADYQHTSVSWEELHLPTVPPTTIDGSDLFEDSFSGAHLHIGTRFGRNFGVELGYMWLAAGEKSLGGGNQTSLQVHGVTLDGLAYLRLGSAGTFELVGLAGGAWLEGTAKLNGPSFGDVRDVDPDWNWRLGGGAQYALTPKISLRGLVTYEAAKFDGEVDHATSVNVGINYYLN